MINQMNLFFNALVILCQLLCILISNAVLLEVARNRNAIAGLASR